MPYLNEFHDVIHGPIALTDTKEAYDGMIRSIIASQSLSRLKRIKQIGFAANAYTTAEHSRFSHSLGTMHVMRRIMNIFASGHHENTSLFETVSGFYDMTLDLEDVIQHMLVAGLLQDVGELPLQQATKHFFSIKETLRNDMSEEFDFNFWELGVKKIFTLASLVKDRGIKDALFKGKKPLNKDFLAFLIAGISSTPPPDEFKVFRNITDGVVDADRIDYVFRDFYHTMGSSFNVDALVEDLIGYDKDGPIFKNAEPIFWFLKRRSMLYYSVYLSPTYRLRKILLMEVLQTIRKDKEYEDSFFLNSRISKWDMDYESFIEFDEVELLKMLKSFSKCIKDHKKIEVAITTLLSGYDNFDYKWVRFNEKGKSNSDIRIPEYVFYDTYNDASKYEAFKEKSIKIFSPEYDFIYKNHESIYLENIENPLGLFFKDLKFRAPIKDAISVFYPTDKDEDVRPFLENIENGNVTIPLLEYDPLLRNAFETVDYHDFIGPVIFISYANEDRNRAIMLSKQLQAKKRKFILMYNKDGEEGIKNSIEKKMDIASCFIVLLSLKYLEKVNKSQCYASIEKEIIRKKKENDNNGEVKVVFAKFNDDDLDQLKDNWNHRDFGFQNAPAIKNINTKQYSRTFDELLTSIC